MALSTLSVLALTVAPIVGLASPAQAIIPPLPLPLPFPPPLPYLIGHTYVVNTTTNTPTSGPGTGNCTNGGSCSFRQAINAYNADTLSFGDTIEFAPSLPNPAVFPITSGVVIDNPSGISLAINGSGVNSTVITGDFDADPGTYIEIDQKAPVSISNLTVEDMAIPENWQIESIDGSSLTLTNVDVVCTGSVSKCQTVGTGGIQIYGGTLAGFNVAIEGNQLSGEGNGGGIEFQNAKVVLFDSLIMSNIGDSGGGIASIAGSLYLFQGTSVTGNSAGSDGGGIWNYSGFVNAIGAQISGNTAGGYGGGIANETAPGPEPHPEFICGLTAINDNSAVTNGGGVYDDSPLDTLIQNMCEFHGDTPNNIFTA